MYCTSGQILQKQTSQKEGWFCLEIDNSIGDYYKSLYSKGNRTWYNCLNGCHVTFIAGEREVRLVKECELTNWYNKDITVWYNNIVYTNGRAFWLSCISSELDQIRVSLGLEPRILYHVTLGNIKCLGF